jgi:hypothetical protein
LANVADEETVIELKKEISPILEKVAHNRSLITYGALASEVGPKVGIPGLIPRDTRLPTVRSMKLASIRSAEMAICWPY